MTRGTWQGSGTWQTSGGMTAGGVAGLVIVVLAVNWAGKHARGISEATVITAIALGAVCVGAVVAGVVVAWRSMRRHEPAWTPAAAPPPAPRPAIPQVTQGTPAIENHYHVHHHYADGRESAAVVRGEVQP